MKTNSCFQERFDFKYKMSFKMRKFLYFVIVSSAMVTSSIASAGTFTSVGVIESLNTKANTIRLAAGNSFKLPADAGISCLSVGQKVQVSWDSQNPAMVNVGRETVFQLRATGINPVD